jgi:hypothetical protein
MREPQRSAIVVASAMHAFGAVFAEVAADADTGTVTVRRVVGASPSVQIVSFTLRGRSALRRQAVPAPNSITGRTGRSGKLAGSLRSRGKAVEPGRIGFRQSAPVSSYSFDDRNTMAFFEGADHSSVKFRT